MRQTAGFRRRSLDGVFFLMPLLLPRRPRAARGRAADLVRGRCPSLEGRTVRGTIAHRLRSGRAGGGALWGRHRPGGGRAAAVYCTERGIGGAAQATEALASGKLCARRGAAAGLCLRALAARRAGTWRGGRRAARPLGTFAAGPDAAAGCRPAPAQGHRKEGGCASPSIRGIARLSVLNCMQSVLPAVDASIPSGGA